MKDDEIRRNRVEQEALVAHRVRAFCGSSNLRGK